ncbi:MAG: hypothetical protein RTV31_13220 [Candidatus Thorarchaeota archaeon]
MTIGLVILSVLSFSLALLWFRRSVAVNCVLESLAERLGEPDTSGKKEYTSCDSYKWAIKNVVYGNYLQSNERFRNCMMNRTMTGTLILGIFLGIIPVIFVYILFQSFNLIGTSLVLIFVAIYIVRGPGTVEISNLLLKWQTQQDLNSFNIGDLAYARISQKSIRNWIQILFIIGCITIAIAPWGEEIPIALAYIITVFLGFAYSNIFIPVSAVSLPLALIIFFIIGPLLLILAGLAVRSVKKKIIKDEGMRL